MHNVSSNGNERMKRVERIFEGKMAENFPNVMKKINLCIQGAQ